MFNAAVHLLSDLIAIPSITPDVECVKFIERLLLQNGFECECVVFEDTANLYAYIGNKNGKNLCFCGHTDVVPLIDKEAWLFGAFNPTINDGKLYGRGAVDMKGGIASFISALFDLLKNRKIDLSKHSISILLTGDEEGTGKNGTRKMLEHIAKHGIKLDYCLIGEPTCKHRSLDSVHIGRRGSFNFSTDINGREGHVAYKEEFDNPIQKALSVCNSLYEHKFLDGDELYPATNLEIVAFDAANSVNNVILNKSSFRGNIRFNSHKHTVASLHHLIKQIHDNILSAKDYQLSCHSTHGGYHSGINAFSTFVKNTISSEEHIVHFATHGGVTDGSFIINYCQNICELGPKDSMMHKINEYIELDDLNHLYDAYRKIIQQFIKLF